MGGKRKNGRKNVKSHDRSVESKAPVMISPPSSTASRSALPLAFPQHLPVPTNDFLRNEKSYEASFQVALETSYLGLVVDPPETVLDKSTLYSGGNNKNGGNGNKKMKTSADAQPPLCRTLQAMASQGIFQTDVTQPFGLGSKCAKTYVTRCLVGDHGTTYKYLGLRMFAYRWDQGREQSSENSNDKSKKSREHSQTKLCYEIGAFKDQVLVPRTKIHLKELQNQRKSQAEYDINRSRSDYNICLINRMDSSSTNYKLEPGMEQQNIAVAWHADSSLEHFSNIAVYQLILPNDKDDRSVNNDNGENSGWQLALRTTPNAEGPNIQADLSPDPNIPQLSIGLPSGSAYYMLDDFNHHHQHAVLYDDKKAGRDTTPTIRYSATYRLLRPSHTVAEVLQQCQRACKSFHKRGVKIWRSEQLLLTHVESEWLRQFYIQGQHHFEKLWKDNWDAPLLQLWKYWQQLEERTRQTIELLQLAAQGKCTDNNNKIDDKEGPPPSKAERKRRDKERKALTTLQGLIERSTAADGMHSGHDALSLIYRPFAELLQERATLREKWQKREKDHAFVTMQQQFRPLPWPVQYNSQSDPHSPLNTEKDSTVVVSSMPGSPGELNQIAEQLVMFGKAFDSGKASFLPAEPLLSRVSNTADKSIERFSDSEKSQSIPPERKQPPKNTHMKGKQNAKRERNDGAHNGNRQQKKKKKKRF